MGKVAIIGVPLDLGGNRRGVDMGPSAVRLTSLATRLKMLGYDVVDTGDVDVPLPEECHVGDPKKKFAKEIGDVCQSLCDRVVKVMGEGRVPVTLGGDHSLAMGSIAGVSKHHRAKGEKVGLIWFDAHGDMNTPESTNSGNVHGMPLAHTLGLGDRSLASIGGFTGKVEPENTVLIGIRDLDEREKRLIQQSRVRVFTMKDVDTLGAPAVMERAIAIASDGTAGAHVSFDIDACDPSIAPGVGTPKRGGLDYREAHLCLELIADSGRLLALDMVEINPILDTRNHTAEFGAELIASALGKQIF